jgi:hypothetical protein
MLVAVICVVCVIALGCAYLSIEQPLYNQGYPSIDKSLMKLQVATSLTAGEIILIINLIFDLDRQISRPFFLRFFKYPKDQRFALNSARIRLENLLSAMETLHSAHQEETE